MHSRAIFSTDLEINLNRAIDLKNPSKTILITDANTQLHCTPLLKSIKFNLNYTLPTGELHKSFNTLEKLLRFLLENKADKNVLLIALGGGMVTDLVGFAASIYKRGVSYINIPTTLLAMVDASIGGKTGIDFNGLKNAVGSMYPPLCILSDVAFLKTLSKTEITSGWAEVLKHLLITNRPLPETIPTISNKDLTTWSGIKYDIIRQDPYEKNGRLALNAGHTVGHAMESFYINNNKPMPHGFAIAAGLWIESYLYKEKFKDDKSFQLINAAIKKEFQKVEIHESDIAPMLDLMANDKKNRNQSIICSFIGTGGTLHIQSAEKGEITNAIYAYIKN